MSQSQQSQRRRRSEQPYMEQDLQTVTLADVKLADTSTDRVVWRYAQNAGMLLVTNNRNNDVPDTLQQTLVDDVTPSSLQVLTVGNAERLGLDPAYRSACAEQLIDILTDLERYHGVPRLYIP